jgi:hypothetical protein
MSSITFTQADLDALKAAFASGALRVNLGDREIIYRSQAELAKAIEVVQNSLSAPSGSAALIPASYKRNNKCD